MSQVSDQFVGVQTVMVYFFFQAEDGIRDVAVTGVQTCALPICPGDGSVANLDAMVLHELYHDRQTGEIGRASCRERVYSPIVVILLNRLFCFVITFFYCCS